jgi:hypothetical protein
MWFGRRKKHPLSRLSPAALRVTRQTHTLLHALPDALADFFPRRDGPDRVALALRALQVQGTRGAGAACPLANCIRQAVGWQGGLYVGRDVVLIGFAGRPAGASITSPPAVGEFIRRFDQGRYPSLEQKTPDVPAEKQFVGSGAV